jgi:hypothetical protein
MYERNRKKHVLIGDDKIKIGDVVYRHPLEGEYCFINR